MQSSILTYQQSALEEIIKFLENKANEYKQAGSHLNGSIPIGADLASETKKIHDFFTLATSSVKKEEAKYFKSNPEKSGKPKKDRKPRKPRGKKTNTKK